MSNDIKTGDRVWVARHMKCCAARPNAVTSFTVEGVFKGSFTCHCGKVTTEHVAKILNFPNPKAAMPLYTLEKFRDFPKSELRDETHDLEVNV